MEKPELITIIEGPTPDFRPNPHRWLDSVLEGPIENDTVICELRTANGEDILERCEQAWREGRPVKLDFPDSMRMRQQIDVVALRLFDVDEGKVLHVWVSLPVSTQEELEEGNDDDPFDHF